MTPTLLDGDVLLVRLGRRVRTGSIVLAQFPAGPDLLVVKRALVEGADGWQVASDNPRAASDSRHYGSARVLGVAGWVWQRGSGIARPRYRRLLPRRLGTQPPVG